MQPRHVNNKARDDGTNMTLPGAPLHHFKGGKGISFYFGSAQESLIEQLQCVKNRNAEHKNSAKGTFH